MFDFVRKHTKIMMFMMFLLIIPAFVLVGINGFRSINGAGETVAKVAGTSIKREEWEATHKSQVDRVRASNPQVDVKLLDSPEARYISLERLVRDHVLQAAAQDAHLFATDASVARELQQNPTIAGLRGPDGRLDMERYRALLAAQGMTPETFEARVRQEMTMRMPERAVLTAEVAPTRLVDVTLNAFFGRREVELAHFVPTAFRAQVNPDASAIEAFYKANPGMFQAPETANVEYAVLDLDSIKKTLAISDADLKSYYDQNAARLSGAEERRASHILINAPKDMPAAERQKAQEKAEALLAQVRKDPASFADVAKKNSQDPGSAAAGGDLNFFGRGAMVKPFEDAAFKLEKGQISDIVVSDFGFHIIKVTDIHQPKQKSFEELKTTLDTELRAQLAPRKYAELAETFTNTVYEQADSLKPAADKLKLDIQTATQVQRQAQPGATGVLANAKLLTALFSADSIEKKRNTEAIEIAANKMVAARITQYTPAHLLPLDTVRNTVRDRIIEAQSAALALKDGTAKLAEWKAHPENAKLEAAKTISRDKAEGLAPAVLNAVMRADTASLPAWIGVDLGQNQGYVVARINKVLDRAAPAKDVAQQERNQYAQWLAAAQDRAYIENLKVRFKAQIKVEKPIAGVKTSLITAE